MQRRTRPSASAAASCTSRCTSFSWRRRYAIRSRMVSIRRPCCFAKRVRPGQAGHRAVVVHDLAEHADRRAARPGARGPRAPRCGRRGAARRRARRAAGRRGRGARGRPAVAVGSASSRMVSGAVGRRDAGGHAAALASTETVNAVPCSAVFSAVMGNRSSASARSGDRPTQSRPRACGHHEVDVRGRRLRRRHDQVALVLALVVVDDDHHAAAADVLERGLDGGELRRRHRRVGGAAPAAGGDGARQRRPRGGLRAHVRRGPGCGLAHGLHTPGRTPRGRSLGLHRASWTRRSR